MLNEYRQLHAVLVKHVRDAFVDQNTIERQWKTLNYTAPPDLARAIDEHDRFIDILRSNGATVHLLAPDPRTTLDSIYVRDASIASSAGFILCAMGKAERAGEPAAQADALGALGIETSGPIAPPGRLEGGDLIWLDDHTLAVGRGYRTNGEGIRQLRAIVGDSVDVVEVPLPHWHGQGDVMHLMSLISPVDVDLAVVYSRLLPVPFRADRSRGEAGRGSGRGVRVDGNERAGAGASSLPCSVGKFDDATRARAIRVRSHRVRGY
jgi:N-dimethylarginine dimethylaminohydrolase